MVPVARIGLFCWLVLLVVSIVVFVSCKGTVQEDPKPAIAKEPAKQEEPSWDLKIGPTEPAPDIRFGLTEQQRKDIIAEVVNCQDNQHAYLENRYPDNLDRQSLEGNIGDERCVDKTLKKHHLTFHQYSKITYESVDKHWPLPPSR